MTDQTVKPLPPCPFGQELEDYWAVRYELFSKFDEGIQLDAEGLYSVKPEAIALEIGQSICGDIVLDAFCGVGGSAIGLARAGKKVITVDIDNERLQRAAHNATLYGVADQIEFINGDSLDVITQASYDSVYLDPPWGGPEYINKEWFLFNAFSPNGLILLEAVFKNVDAAALTVPLNFDLRELVPLKRDFCIQWAFVGKNWDALGGSPIFSTLYFGRSLASAKPHLLNARATESESKKIEEF